MATKKPKIYTTVGKIKKPAPAKKPAPKNPAIAHLEDLLKTASQLNEAREMFYTAMLEDVAARTTKLWFGYSLVRPVKK